MAVQKGDLIQATEIFQNIFPVGSIYLTVTTDNPSKYFGGTWKKCSEGRVLQGCTSSENGGTTKEAGLPNIWGTTDGIEAAGYSQRQTGAFYLMSEKGIGSNDSDYDNLRVGFDASRCSGIYGRSSTVQPPAFLVHIWQRIA